MQQTRQRVGRGRQLSRTVAPWLHEAPLKAVDGHLFTVEATGDAVSTDAGSDEAVDEYGNEVDNAVAPRLPQILIV